VRPGLSGGVDPARIAAGKDRKMAATYGCLAATLAFAGSLRRGKA